MTKQADRVLKINSCLDCPHHSIEHDPSSGDSFDWGDSALACTLVPPTAEEVKDRLVRPTKPCKPS